MTNKLAGKRIAVLATDGVEQVEMTQPWKAAEDEGARITLVSTRTGTIHGYNHDDPGDTFSVGATISDVTAEAFDALIVPGGVRSPDRLRVNRDAVDFVRAFWDAGKPIAAICHGPWMLVEADIVGGRTLTSWPSLKTDIENAGGHWVDEECHVDEGLVTSRKPDDLPEFCAKMIEEFGEGRHDRSTTRSAAHATTASR